MNHFCKIKEIKINTKLSAKQAYDTAKQYQATYDIGGTIPEDLNQAVYLDEKNHITKNITWMIRSMLEENTFEGMDELTIMVLDENNQVYSVLDCNGIPICDKKEQLYSDKELYQIFDDNETL